MHDADDASIATAMVAQHTHTFLYKKMAPLPNAAANMPSERGSHTTAVHLAVSLPASGVSVLAMRGLLLGAADSWARKDSSSTA